MSEDHFDEYEHYNFDQDKNIHSGHSGKRFELFDDLYIRFF